MMYSSNGGTSWTTVDVGGIFGTSAYSMINAIAYGGNRFVVGGLHYESRAATVAYSSDGGMSWTAMDVSSIFGTSAYSTITTIAYGGNRFVVGGYSYNSSITDGINVKMGYSSDGGTSWTAVDVSNIFGANLYNFISAIAYDGNRFVAGGNSYNVLGITEGGVSATMAYSSDGISWTAADVSSIFGANEYNAISVISYGGNRFVIGGYSSNILAGANGAKIAYSNDGVSWTGVDMSGTFSTTVHNGFQAIAYGSNRFVVSCIGYDENTERIAKMAWCAWP
jgi:hypothetical protein